MKKYYLFTGLFLILAITYGFYVFLPKTKPINTELYDPRIEIYSVYHKKSRIFANDIVIPIHAGRALHLPQGEWLLSRMIGDDTGDNISAKNSRYSELTALYWLWKNSTADYVGLMHYRRRFVIKNRREDDNCGRDYLCFLGITKENILEILQDYDAIAPKGLPLDGHNIYDHYASCHYISDFDAALDYIRTKNPEMSDFIDDWLQNTTYYPFNMFIMKKELLDEYAAWLFDVLFAIDDKINVNHYLTDPSPRVFPTEYSYQQRTPGFIAERLFDLWFRYHGYKVKIVDVEYGSEYNPIKLKDKHEKK